ncbi:MAG TPA: glycerophosphodiester phosphodiesterase family protein [Methylomirabilota bacterium]|nr:glycerophosphodiester phosphodiesterase family protein [Methylomirabilota bacterium]
MKRLAVALLGIVLVAPAAAAGPLVAAHRGGAALWPENSLLAFRNAVALGADFLETDVHLTADGEVVVLHDPTLERTTTGSGRVAALRLADLHGLRLKARDGTVTDEPIPTLASLLEVVVASSARLLLEIKVDADRARYPGIEEKVLALVQARGLRDRTVVMAFQTETLRRVRALDPTIRTSLLVGRAAGDGVTAVSVARAVGASDLGLDHRLVDSTVVDFARASRLTLAAWTVNTEADLRRVIDLGVAIVISDRPDLALKLAR